MKTNLGLVVGSLLLSSLAAADTTAPDFVAARPPLHVDRSLVASSGTNRIEPGDIVSFMRDSAALDEASLAQVDRVAAWLTAHPEQTIVLEGHTDTMGSVPYNNALADRRIGAVRQRLLQHRIASDRIVMLRFGEIATAENPAAKRVRIYATTMSPEAIVALTPPGSGVVATWTTHGALVTGENGAPPQEVPPTETSRR